MSEALNFLHPDVSSRTAIVTTTMFPGFNPGSKDPRDVDSVRGRLALSTLESAREQGIRVSLVEDGSSHEFVELLRDLDIDYLKGGEGMGPGRRKAFRNAINMPGVDQYFWTEPEKAPLVRYCLPDFISPLGDENIGLVIANRNAAGFATYPTYQLETEYRANDEMNQFLRRDGLWHDPDIDFLFAPRFYRNTDTNARYLLERVVNKIDVEPNDWDDQSFTIDFDRWANSIVIPVLRALHDQKYHDGDKVALTEVPYLHPKEQTESEVDSPLLAAKRFDQYRTFVYSTELFLRYLKGDPDSKLVLEK